MVTGGPIKMPADLRRYWSCQAATLIPKLIVRALPRPAEVGYGQAGAVSDSGSRTGAGNVCQVRSDAVSILVPTLLTCADVLEQRLCSLACLVHT
jgi:hypothetical protein